MSISTSCRVAAAALGLLLSGTAIAGAPVSGGWAVVTADGRLGPNTNVVKVHHKNAGIYRVEFNNDVSRCATNVTLAAHDGKTITPGYVVVEHNKTTPNQVRVFTFLSTTLVASDFKFNLLVNC